MRTRTMLSTPLLILLLYAAASAQHPRATTDPEATPVAASRDRTWEAVMAYTTENSHYFLGIETVDKESGLLISRPTYFPMGAKRSWADCGKTLVLPNFPDKVIWNIVVTGNDTSSTVRVNGRWFHNEGEPCKASKGVLEREMMDRIRAYAERSR